MNNCSECKNRFLVDYGYSSYTVEGTETHCVRDLHPEGSFDHWYGHSVDGVYAAICPEFEAGDSAGHVDVDREELDGDPELTELYETVMAQTSQRVPSETWVTVKSLAKAAKTTQGQLEQKVRRVRNERGLR